MAQTMIMQYREMKKKNPDAVLLFRCGDFYETYEQDAETAAEVFGITLTVRNTGENKGIKMAGFPYHALDNYLPRFIRAGHRVAICDQLEDPKLAKKLVKRGITDLINPGIRKTPTFQIQINHRDVNGEGIEELLPTKYDSRKDALDAMERGEGKLVMQCLAMGHPFGCGWASKDVYEVVYKTEDNKQTVQFRVICTTGNA